METITLNDGTVLNGHALGSGDGRTLFVYITGITMLEGVQLFSSPIKTRIITANGHGEEHEYTGFTSLYAVSMEFGNCNIVMRKGD